MLDLDFDPAIYRNKVKRDWIGAQDLFRRRPKQVQVRIKQTGILCSQMLVQYRIKTRFLRVLKLILAKIDLFFLLRTQMNRSDFIHVERENQRLMRGRQQCLVCTKPKILQLTVNKSENSFFFFFFFFPNRNHVMKPSQRIQKRNATSVFKQKT